MISRALWTCALCVSVTTVAMAQAAATSPRDPFVPSADPQRFVSTEPLPMFSAEVTAVLLAGSHRYATLRLSPHDLMVVEVGQVIGRWKVQSITPTAVQCATTYMGKSLPVTLSVRRGVAAPPTALTTTALPAGSPAADLPLLPPPVRPVGSLRPERP